MIYSNKHPRQKLGIYLLYTILKILSIIYLWIKTLLSHFQLKLAKKIKIREKR